MSVDVAAVRREKDEIEARYGAWTAHNIRLADGLYTISPEPAGDEVKLRRVRSSPTTRSADRWPVYASSICVSRGHVLDRAGATRRRCRGDRRSRGEHREGAVRGADAWAHVDFQLGDVRDLTRDRHGEFDVVLGLGILYHLDVDDVVSVVERIGTVSRRALIVDTGVGSPGTESFGDYRGIRLVEHRADSTEEERRDAVWSSLDNLTAVALTRPSLERALARQGFTVSSSATSQPSRRRRSTGSRFSR